MMDGYGMFGGGWLIMILWWVLIIGAIAVVVKWLMSSSSGTNVSGRSALDILRERYARGEINQEEYQSKLRDLGG